MDNFSKIKFLLSNITFITGYFFIIFLFNKFLKNTQNIKLFFEPNIKILNKILFIFLGLFFIKLLPFNLFTMVFNEDGLPRYVSRSHINLNFLFYDPIIIIFFYILKVVFKRGQELKIENDLTI